MRFVFTICLCALLATACSKVPNQATYPYSYQQKMQSADHWEKLAAKVVSNQVSPFFTHIVNDMSDPILGVHIDDQDKSSFGTAFKTYLATALFQKSIPVSKSSSGCYTLDWSVQKVLHNAERKNPGPPFGIIGGAVAAVGSLFGGDYYFWRDVPHTELLVTIKLRVGDIIYSRNTETLYINDEDTAHYWVLPEDSSGATLASVRKGSVLCREPKDLEQAFTYDTAGVLQLDNVIKGGKCAIATDNYPVSVIEDRNNYFIIRSEEKPYYFYVTPSESLGG